MRRPGRLDSEPVKNVSLSDFAGETAFAPADTFLLPTLPAAVQSQLACDREKDSCPGWQRMHTRARARARILDSATRCLDERSISGAENKTKQLKDSRQENRSDSQVANGREENTVNKMNGRELRYGATLWPRFHSATDKILGVLCK